LAADAEAELRERTRGAAIGAIAARRLRGGDAKAQLQRADIRCAHVGSLAVADIGEAQQRLLESTGVQ